ncbi:MAG: hypothetical protein R3F51_26970 [Cyanobacteriota/Melainabacteria group bacterium]
MSTFEEMESSISYSTRRTDMQLDGQSHSWNYRTYYEATQPKYANNWKSAHDALERRFKQDPTLKT